MHAIRPIIVLVNDDDDDAVMVMTMRMMKLSRFLAHLLGCFNSSPYRLFLKSSQCHFICMPAYSYQFAFAAV